MDSLRGFDEDAGWSAAVDDEPTIERPPEIGVDERRMHVRAYNYWVSLLDGRPYPSIEDLKPERIGDFGPHSVILDFSRDEEDPDITFVGSALKRECGLGPGADRISQVPPRSLMSRLTDHYLQIIANRAPIGFEAEFLSSKSVNTLYRGILMPLSTNGQEIDFVYGVINWKELADSGTANGLAGEVDRAIAAKPDRGDLPIWADGPHAELAAADGSEPARAAQDEAPTLSLWPDEDEAEASEELPADAGLADRLGLARASAEHARTADHRSRAALYRALGHAYDFALAAEAEAEDYRDLLEDAGLKAQQRAPMTPVVKLVFGADYDKKRLTEFAAALAWAHRMAVEVGSFAAILDSFDGGLKAVVAAERCARRPAATPDRSAARRERLRAAPPLQLLDACPLAAGTPVGDFVLLLGRQEADGRVAIVAPALTDAKLIERAVAQTAD